jgi:N-carbamoylputrescine amidase
MSDRAAAIALVQQRATPNRDDNLRRGLAALERAAEQGARIVGYPELAVEPFYPQEPARGDVRALAEPIPGPTTERFASAARRLGVVVVLNLFERAGDRTFDSSPVIDAEGRCWASHAWCTSPTARFHEQVLRAGGPQRTRVRDQARPRRRCYCYDRHSQVMRALALGGARSCCAPGRGGGEWPGLYKRKCAWPRFEQVLRRAGEPRRRGARVIRRRMFVCDPAGHAWRARRRGRMKSRAASNWTNRARPALFLRTGSPSCMW